MTSQAQYPLHMETGFLLVSRTDGYVCFDDIDKHLLTCRTAFFLSTELAYFDGNDLIGEVPAGFCDISRLTLYADCEEVKCPCCTHCCNSTGYCDATGTGNPFAEVASPFDPYPSRSGILAERPPRGEGGPPGGTAGGGPPP